MKKETALSYLNAILLFCVNIKQSLVYLNKDLSYVSYNLSQKNYFSEESICDPNLTIRMNRGKSKIIIILNYKMDS